MVATITPTKITGPVYSYLRFSTPEQRHGTGQQRQDDLAEHWCAERGLSLARNYADLGVSAFKGKNATEGALSEFLRCVEDRRVPAGSVLIVESLDRLSREKINKAAELFLRIINHGVSVVTLCDGYEYNPENFSFAQLVMSLAIFMRANDESNMKSQRKAAAWKMKREKAKKENKALGGKTPSWIGVVDGRYTIIREEADKVRAIFRDYVDGLGLYLLNKKYGTPKATLSYWLTNPVVLGTITMVEEGKRIALPNHYPAIIDTATWRAAQARKAERFIARRPTGRAGFVNLFAGLLHNPSGNRYDVTRTYGFSSYVTDGHVIQARPLEQAIILGKLASHFVRKQQVEEIDPATEAKVGKLDKKISEIRDAMLAEDALAADLLPILKELRLQRDQEASAGSVVRERVSLNLIRQLITSSEEERDARLRLREIVRDTVERIDVTKVQAQNWYTMVAATIHLTDDGGKVPLRFAYCSRRDGWIMCAPPLYSITAPDGTKIPSHPVIKASSLGPELIAALNELPLRRARDYSAEAKAREARKRRRS